MTKNKIIVIIVALLAVVGLAAFYLYKNQIQNSGTGPNTTINGNEGIEIYSPSKDQLISSPLNITGIVKGNGWTGFEGQVGTVKLLDSTGKELGIGILAATTDWMKLPAHFESTIYFDYPGDGTGSLVFHNENASGEPSRDKTFTLPVKLQKSSSDKISVKVYFSNTADTNDCANVFYAQRTIPKTEAVAKAALEQLLLGPTALEKNAGFMTSINDGVVLKSITIENGVAKVDFNDQLQKNVAGSCKVTAIRAQITQTLKQFPTVSNVIISINGKTEGILQP